MSKGSYTVYKPQNPNSKNDSWKSCTCSLLVFSVICLIILLVAWPFRKPHGNSYGHSEHETSAYQQTGLKTKQDTEVFSTPDPNGKQLGKIIKETSKPSTEFSTIREEIGSSSTKLIDVEDTKQKTTLEHISTTISHYPTTEIHKTFPNDPDIWKKTVVKNENDEATRSQSNEYDLITPKPLENDFTSVTDNKDSHEPTRKYFSTTGNMLIDLLQNNYEETFDGHTNVPTEIIYLSSSTSKHKIMFPITQNSDILSSTLEYPIQNNYHYIETTTEQNKIYDSHSTTQKDSIEITSQKSKPLENEQKITTVSYSEKNPDQPGKSTVQSITEISPKIDTYQTMSQMSTEAYHNKLTTEKYTKRNKTNYINYYGTEPKVCDSITCKNIGSKSLIMINYEKNICNDFYGYACGGFSKDILLEKNPTTDLFQRLKNAIQSSNIESSKHLTIFKNYFTSCMEYSVLNGLAPAKKALYDVGNFQSTLDESAPSNIVMLLADLMKRKFPILFDINIDIDPTTKKFGTILVPVFPDINIESLARYKTHEKVEINKNDYGNNKINLNEAYDQFKEKQMNFSDTILHVKEALIHFGVFSDDIKLRDKLVHDVLISLEFSLFECKKKYLKSAYERKKELKHYEVAKEISIKVLKRDIPQIDWEYLLPEIVGHSFNDNDKIRVFFYSYLKNVISDVMKTDARELHNSILAMYAGHLYKRFFRHQSEVGDRSSYCLQMSSDLLKDVSSALYLDSFTREKIVELDTHAKDVFDQLVTTLSDKIENVWVSDPNDMEKAKKKINNLKFISIREKLPWQNSEILSRIEELTIKDNSFVENTLAIEERNQKKKFDSLNEDPLLPENLWTLVSLPSDTSPFIIRSLDVIVLPLGAICTDLENIKDYPQYVSMAELGFNLAKQMNLYLEMSHISLLRKHVLHQPGNVVFEMEPTNGERSMTVKINPSELIPEVMSNIAGAKLAYMAYYRYDSKTLAEDLPIIWSNKTIGQLYFLLVAQQFCTKNSVSEDLLGLFEGNDLPPIFAVNSIAVNLDEFFDTNFCSQEPNMTAAIKIPMMHITSTTSSYDPMDTVS